MSSDRRRRDVASLEGRRVFDLSQPFEPGMPQSPNHPRYQLALVRRHGDAVRADGSSAANELIVLGGHVGTHIDALCHVSHDGLLYGGVSAEEAQRGGRFAAYGVETLAPLVCRGVLLDVARARGVERMAPGYVITSDDLHRAADAHGVAVAAGDVVLVRTGWSALWSDAEAFVGHASGVPGPGVEAATWLADLGVRATGADTIAYEALAPGAGHSLLPVHRLLLVERGIHIIETLQLDELAAAEIHEFLFVAAPLRLVGATGSPLRPLAIA